jgi:hypothetical protein
MTPARPTRLHFGARETYRTLELLRHNLAGWQESILRDASRLPEPIPQRLLRLHLGLGKIIDEVLVVRESMELSGPPPESRPAKGARVRAVIDVAVTEERKDLLSRLLSHTGETQTEFCNRYCLRTDDLSRWKSRSGGIKPGAQQDTLIRSYIASDLQAFELEHTAAPIRKLGASEKIQ